MAAEAEEVVEAVVEIEAAEEGEDVETLAVVRTGSTSTPVVPVRIRKSRLINHVGKTHVDGMREWK